MFRILGRWRIWVGDDGSCIESKGGAIFSRQTREVSEDYPRHHRLENSAETILELCKNSGPNRYLRATYELSSYTQGKKAENLKIGLLKGALTFIIELFTV